MASKTQIIQAQYGEKVLVQVRLQSSYASVRIDTEEGIITVETEMGKTTIDLEGNN